MNFFRKWKESKQFNSRYEKMRNEVFVLYMKDAKELAEALLVDPKKFRCIESQVIDIDQFKLLSPTLKEFFTKYEKIRAVFGDMQLNRNEVELSSSDDAFIKIGTDIECELVVRPGGDTIYQLDSLGVEEPGFPSVYHLIILTNRILYT